MDLKAIRISRGVSQKVVSDALGCSTVVYSRYETGARQPPIEVLISLADFYGISMDELVGRVPMDAGAKAYVKNETPPPQGDDELSLQFPLDDDDPQDDNDLEATILRILQQELNKRGV